MARVNKGVVLTQEITFESEAPQPTGPPTRWQENHGNLLMTFVAIVLLVGASVLIYRQNRFVPPRFPESDMIAAPVRPVDEASKVDPKDTVTIKVSGAANDLGTIKIAIYESESTFNQTEKAWISETLSIVEGEATCVIPVRLPERMAVAAYHDENNDSVLNRNRFGIPTERYGFSQNARGLNGPPSFQQAVIERPLASESIIVFIR